MFALFLKLAEAAQPVIRHFAADFYLHDAKVLAGMKPGDVALWKPRESGSCLVIVARGRVANEHAREGFEAHAALFGADKWWLIDTDINGNWTAEETDDGALHIAEYAVRTDETNRQRVRQDMEPAIVRERHM